MKRKIISKDRLRKFFQPLLIVFTVLIFAASISFFLFPYVFSYLDLKAIANSMAADGKAEFFTKEFYSHIVSQLRLGGAIFTLLGFGLIALRPYITDYLTSILTKLVAFLKKVFQVTIQKVKQENKIHVLALFIIIVAAVLVRLFFLYQPMRYDEAFTFRAFASKPLYVGLSLYTVPNNHLLHTFLVHLAYVTLGNQPWILRLPALIAGILIVPITYITTRLLYKKQAGLIAASLVASSSVLIEFSTNARGYTLLILFSLLLISVSKYIIQTNDLGAWVLFSIIVALGAYTIPIMIFPFSIAIVWILGSSFFEKTNQYKFIRNLSVSIVGTGMFTLILYSPVLLISGPASLIGNRFVEASGWSYVLSELPSLSAKMWSRWSRDLPFALELVLVIGFMNSLLFHKKIAKYKIPIFLATIVGIGGILIVHPALGPPRIWLFLLPLFFILASSGLYYLLKFICSKVCELYLLPIELTKYLSIIFSLLLVISQSAVIVSTESPYYSDATGTLRDAKDITQTLQSRLDKGDSVLFEGTSGPSLRYYFKKHEIPQNFLESPESKSTGAYWLVVNKRDDQTIKGILKCNKLSVKETKTCEPKLIQKYKFAVLYKYDGSCLQNTGGH